jgi:hypothetical protein
VNDIEDASSRIEDFRERLEKVPASDSDGELYFGVLLRAAWQAKGGPALAQRIFDIKDRLFPRGKT